MNKEKILEAIKTAKIVFPIDDAETIEREIQSIEQETDLPFSVRSVGSGGDYWLQVEYYSKIGKTIIFDYDFDGYFDDAEDLAETLFNTAQSVLDFENRLTLQNND